MPIGTGPALTPESLLSDGWVPAGGPSGCNCCQSGSVPPICCPDYACHGICATVDGSVTTFHPAGGGVYPVAAITSTVYYGPNQGMYFEEVELLDAGPPEVWCKKIISLFIECDAGTLSPFQLHGFLAILTLSVNGVGTPTYSGASRVMDTAIGICSAIDIFLQDDVFSGGNTTAQADVNTTMISGDCGGPCCTILCAGGSTWFCAPDMPVGPVFGTFSGGGGTITLTITSLTIQGKCVIWLYSIAAAPGSSGIGLTINCDGTVYGQIQYSADGAGNPLTQLEQVGTVTTVNSCSPVDVIVTFTTGPYSGQTLHITE